MAEKKDPLEAGLRQGFNFGYRNREDVTTLPANVMVSGSRNVLTNVFQHVANRQGYVLDGQRDSSGTRAGIYGSYDFQSHAGFERNLRCGQNTTGSNGVLQYRYVATAGDVWNGHTFTEDQVYWIDLKTGVGETFNACSFWESTNEQSEMMLYVDGTSNIFMWTGALGTIASTSNAAGSVSVLNPVPTAAGTGYVVGDILTITTGGTGATAIVASVNGSGAVQTVTAVSPGSGYTTGAGKVTTGGSGSGATLNITTVATGYIQLNGTQTAAQLGFLYSSVYTQAVLINTNSYTYSKLIGVYLVGISSSPTGEVLQSVVQQAVVVTPNSSITDLPDNFTNNIIENLSNQVYVSATNDNSVFVSKISNFKDFSFGTPRLPGEGAELVLDGVPTTIVPQGDSMYLSAGKNYWYQTLLQLSADNMSEALTVNPLKVTALQASQSDALAVRIKNLIAFVSNEVQINTLGIIPDYLSDPQVVDISSSIVNDVKRLNFNGGVGGQSLYLEKFLYVTSPADGVMLIFNMTQDVTEGVVDNSQQHYWEAPQLMPIGRLSIIDGELYGHNSGSNNTYKLFTGYNDDGASYTSLALFAYDNHGSRSANKSSDEFYVEGYKTQSTVLSGGLRRDLNGPVASWSWGLLPDRNLIVQVDDASIGKISIGKTPIGGTLNETDPTDTPPKFRLIQTFNKTPYFEEQVGFGTDGIDQRWEIVAFATNAQLTTENQASIYDPNSNNQP